MRDMITLFPLPVNRPAQQQHVGDDEAQREYLRRSQTSKQQQLRKHEGAAPNGHHNECYKMIFQSTS